MSWAERILDLLFPPKCPFCSRVLDRPGICPKCREDLSWTGEQEGLWKLSGGLRCAAPLWYREQVRQGLLGLKFHGAAGAAEPLGALVAQWAGERLSGEFDVVTWVPVSRRRRRKRGYDQAELLARAACRVWGTRPERLLEKFQDNPPQSGMGERRARQDNVRGVYRPVSDIQGRRILLIDDICTTGATLEECAGVLWDSGAENVVCAVVARTPRNDQN